MSREDRAGDEAEVRIMVTAGPGIGRSNSGDGGIQSHRKGKVHVTVAASLKWNEDLLFCLIFQCFTESDANLVCRKHFLSKARWRHANVVCSVACVAFMSLPLPTRR